MVFSGSSRTSTVSSTFSALGALALALLVFGSILMCDISITPKLEDEGERTGVLKDGIQCGNDEDRFLESGVDHHTLVLLLFCIFRSQMIERPTSYLIILQMIDIAPLNGILLVDGVAIVFRD